MSAVIQNEYIQANNSTVLRNFTFPYLKTSDIKVSLDGVETTAFTRPSATQIQLNSVPAVGTKIKIFRETSVDDLTATFYAGSAIKSEDLNDNFTQNLYKTQEVGARALNTLGGTMTGDLTMGEATKIIFEGASDDAHETTLTVADPTADRTITFPNVTGTVVTTGDTGTVATGMIAGDAITNALIADNQIDSEHYVDGSIDRVHLASDVIDGTKIADDVINSEHYAAGSIDREHLAADIVDGTKIADDAIGNEHIATDAVNADSVANNAIDTNAIQNSAVTNGKIADNAINQAEMADDSIGAAELIDNAVGSAALASNAVTNVKMADSSVGTSELVNDAVTAVKITDNAVTMAKLAGGALPTDITVASVNIVDGTILEADIADDAVTDDKIATGTLDGRYYTKTNAESIFLRQDSSETIASGVTWSSSDAFVATTAAIDARVIDLVDDVGGFVPIANRNSFPTANPDVNNGAGTIVSVTDAGGIVVAANGSSNTPQTTSGATVTITGMSSLANTTIASGFGILLETTSTLHTYTFHRLVPKATEVTTVAANAVAISAAGNNVTDINNFVDRYQISTSAPTARSDSSSLQNGDLWFDSSSNKVMMVYDGTSGDGFSNVTPNASDLANVNIVAGQITFQEDLGLITNAVSTGTGNSTLNTVAGIASNVTTVAGIASNVTAVAADATDIGAVAGKATEIGRLGTADAVADMNTLGTTAIVSDMDTLADISSNITTVAGISGNVTTVAGVASNVTTVAGNTTNINTVASNNSNVSTVGAAIGNVNTVAGSISNVNTVNNSIANVNTTAGSITNVNTVASNIADVNNFAAKYRIASSDPTSSLDSGDLYFNTSSNELRVYNGSAWQGGVTATSGFLQRSGGTMTGNVLYNDNVKAQFGTGTDLEMWHSSTSYASIIRHYAKTGTALNNLYIDSGQKLILRSHTNGTSHELFANFNKNGSAELYYDHAKKFETTSTGATVTGLLTATTIDGAAGDNLQLDFGSIA